jgi:hypothetical protein
MNLSKGMSKFTFSLLIILREEIVCKIVEVSNRNFVTFQRSFSSNRQENRPQNWNHGSIKGIPLPGLADENVKTFWREMWNAQAFAELSVPYVARFCWDRDAADGSGRCRIGPAKGG